MPQKAKFLSPLNRVQAIALLVCTTSALAQQAPAPSAPGSAADAPAKPAAVTPAFESRNTDDEAIALSPFEVRADENGYFSGDSMSGTRFNSKVEDLAASLTVVTKEMMDDFAVLNVNDVFNLTAGTEGTMTFTDYTIDRNGQLSDNVQLDPNNANRVRGIMAANQSYGNFEISRLSMDRLITDGIEVSRGPNANVFGLGYAAGTVNQVPASANLRRDRTRSELRADSYGGYRSTIDFNRVLIKGVLAMRFNAAYQHEGFVRKPSGMETIRHNGYIKVQPFRNTTVSASYLFTKSYGNRPNFTPPRDYISDWISAGKPSWDPVLQVIHRNGETIDALGVVSGGRAISPINTDAKIPSYIPLSRGPNNSRNNVYVEQDGSIGYWSVPGTTSTVTGALPTPTTGSQSVRLMATNIFGANGGRFANQPLWTTTPTIADQGYYDWSSINLSAPNRQLDRTTAYNVQLDQVLLNSARQTLFVQASLFREDSMRYQRQPLGNSGISGQTGQLYVDIDEKRLDGTVNPYFLRPFISTGEFTTRYQPAQWNTYRLQAAYKLDLRRERSWLKWLGLHEFTAYDEYKSRINRQYSYREALTSTHPWTSLIPANQNRSNQSGVNGGWQPSPAITRSAFRYYIGDAGDTTIDYAPGDFQHGAYPFVWGGYKTYDSKTGIVNPTTGSFSYEPATLALMPTTDQTGGNYNTRQIIKTAGAVLQSKFLANKVVTTLGIRQDKVYSKNGVNAITATTPYAGANLLPDASDFDWAYNNQWQPGDYRYNTGKTKTAGVVVRPFRDLPFITHAAQRGGVLSYVAEAFRGLSLSYNQSDNFYPQAPAIDLYRNQLPNITGEGKDYGFWLSFFENKVVLRFNHYSTKQLNIRNGDANTIAQRALRLDLDVSSDHYQLYDRATDWWRLTNPTWTDTQVRQAVADQMQIPLDEYDTLQAAFRAGTIAATNDYTASGNEIELNVNPNRYWRLSGSLTQQKAITSNVSNVVQQWIDRRLPVWNSIVDQNYTPTLGTGVSAGWLPTADNPNHLWWIHGYNGTSYANGYFANNVLAPYKVIKQQEGKSKPSVREYQAKLATSLDLAAISRTWILKDVRVGASGNWQDKGAIGYYGREQYPAVVTELDPDRPIYDKARLYVGAFVSYRTKLFRNKVNANFQVNVENLTEGGRLQPIGAFPDGTPNAYRIVDPRKFIFSASFDL